MKEVDTTDSMSDDDDDDDDYRDHDLEFFVGAVVKFPQLRNDIVKLAHKAISDKNDREELSVMLKAIEYFSYRGFINPTLGNEINLGRDKSSYFKLRNAADALLTENFDVGKILLDILTWPDIMGLYNVEDN